MLNRTPYIDPKNFKATKTGYHQWLKANNKIEGEFFTETFQEFKNMAEDKLKIAEDRLDNLVNIWAKRLANGEDDEIKGSELWMLKMNIHKLVHHIETLES